MVEDMESWLAEGVLVAGGSSLCLVVGVIGAKVLLSEQNLGISDTAASYGNLSIMASMRNGFYTNCFLEVAH